MTTEKKTNKPVVVGIFITIGIAILVATIFTLGGQKKTFVRSFTINAIFDDVNGLLKGGNIWFSGVKIGSVKKISFYGQSQVLVTMSIEQDAQPEIRKNAKAKIGSDGLIGNKIIIIYGGDASAPQVEKGDFLAVEKALSTDDMMATLQRNNLNILQITNDFKSISSKIDSGTGLLALLVNDPLIASRLNNSINNLDATTANFKAVSTTGKNVMNDIQHFSGELNRPGNSMNDLVRDKMLYKDIQSTIAQLEHAADNANKVTDNLKTISNRLDQKDNALGVLINDKEAASSLKNTLKNLELGSHKLDQDLEALQHNFLLRGFFRKKAKAEQKLEE